jgi:DNA-binding transcriptional ArsR family regulator
MSAGARAELHRLIDELDEDQAARLLQVVSDPLERGLMLAPLDDEPLSEEDKAAIAEGEAAYRRGDWMADSDRVL